MSARPKVLLDWSGDAQIPEGYQAIASEVAFLACALQSAPIAVVGNSLCRWAEDFCRGRGIVVKRLRNLVDELCSVCDGLERQDAKAVIELVGDSLADDVTPVSVMRSAFPTGPWDAPLSKSHAARWLLWLDETEPQAVYSRITAAVSQSWENAFDGPERSAYSASSPEAARDVLYGWLGIRPLDGAALGKFPLVVPDRWIKRAQEEWGFGLLHEGARLFDVLRNRAVCDQLLQTAALDTSGFLQNNREQLTQDVIRGLEPYLPTQVANDLRRLLPPPDPGDLPEDPDDILNWVAAKYLPYRKWQADYGDEQACARVTGLAAGFADWYLKFYADSLSGGAGKAYLCLSAASALRMDSEDDVVLWVVLDGLHLADASELIRYIQASCQRLTVGDSNPVYGVVPTITEFAKPALLNGQPPVLATQSGETCPGFRQLPETKDPTEVLRSAERGSKFVWLSPEPDRTYHKSADRATILDAVQTQLRGIADRIAKAVDAVPESLLMKLIVATDHGRLMGGGQRAHRVPDGMVAHGRAAFGESGCQFPASGILFDPESGVTYISRSRFHTPQDCALVVNEEAFETSDGKGGIEQFAHGGVYPEEVIIPWVELLRDAVPPKVKVTVSGKGKARSAGECEVSIENPSERRVIMHGLRLLFGKREMKDMAVHAIATPQTTERASGFVEQWPSQTELASASAVALLKLPNGLRFEVKAELALDSEEMYSRGIDLEDFS